MQILMSRAAHARTAARLADLGADLDVVEIDNNGLLFRQGEPLAAETLDPEVFWMSLDLYQNGGLPAFFGHMLGSLNGKWAQIFAAGLDSPAFKMVMQKGIRLTKSNAQAPAIAEYVLAHAFSLLHPIAEAGRIQADHEWRFLPFREISSTNWLLVGFGNIGMEIARRLHPFGAHLTVLRRTVAPEPLADEVRHISELSTLLPHADVVVLACSLNETTTGLADQAFFEEMKPGSLLINIGRGALIDEEALRLGLDRNQPCQAVLDVFSHEPLPTGAWFWDHPKVRITSHSAGGGDGVLDRGDTLFLENLKRYRAGQPLTNEAGPSEVGL